MNSLCIQTSLLVKGCIMGCHMYGHALLFVCMWSEVNISGRPEVTISARLTLHWVPRICLSLPSNSSEYHTWPWHGFLESKLRFPCLSSLKQALYPLSHLPSPLSVEQCSYICKLALEHQLPTTYLHSAIFVHGDAVISIFWKLVQGLSCSSMHVGVIRF